MAFEREFTKNIPDKLEHLPLSPIYENLIDSCLIFTYNSSEKCCCDHFKGCQMKPLTSWLDGERNCFICIMKIDYNIYKIYKIKRNIDIINLYRKLMKDVQLCINFDYKIFWVCSFKTKKEIEKNKFNKTYSRYIRNFTNDGYSKICITDLRKNLVNFTFNIS